MTQKYKEFYKALEEYTGEITIKDQENPVLLNLSGEDISVFLGNLRPISGEENHVRHTMSAKNIDIQRQHRGNGFKVAFIGVYSGENNYCAWDPNFVLSSVAAKDTSLRAPRLHKKERLGSPVIDRHRRYTSIIMPSSALGPYLDNVEAFHSMTDNDKIIEALSYGMNYSSEDPPRYDYTESGKKTQLVFRGTLRKSRDEKFRRDVMHAYGNTCCICGLQFEAEAAHIVPHKDEKTNQTVRNGMALCPNHHRMYDRHLLKINSEYRISINHEKVNELRREGLVGGLDDIMKLEGKQISLPQDKEAWPSKEYLELRNKMVTDS